MTIPCVLAGLAGGAAYFGSMELDATKPIMVRAFLFIWTLHRLSFLRALIHFSFSAVPHWVAWACTVAFPAVSLAHPLYHI
jgi:hypothetical protein